MSRRNMLWVVQNGVYRKSLSKEFSFRERSDSSATIRIKERWERWSTEIVRDVFGQYQKFFETLELERFAYFVLKKNLVKNIFGTIPGRNIQSVIFRSLKAHVPLLSSLSIFVNVRTSVIEPWFLSVRERESMWNVCFHPGEDYLLDALSTHREVPDLKAISILREIREHP